MLTIQSIRRQALASAVVLALAFPAAVAVPVFSEDFEILYDVMNNPVACQSNAFPGGPGTFPFPSGWFLRNVDNRTPAANVSYVNEAWEVREDFALDVTNCAMFSTSWYSPPGAANDWAWTPAIAIPAGGATLTWKAITYDPSYPDGYEVRVMTGPNGPPTGGTGVIGNQITNSSQVFSVAAEATAWTSHTFDLAAYTGQTVYIGFHNNSNDKFLLLIDDVKVLDTTPNLVAQAPSVFNVDYARVPVGIPVDVSFGATAYNGGGSILNNLAATATVKRNGAQVGPPMLSDSIATLAIGASAPVTFAPGFTLSGAGMWTVSYYLSATQTPSESSVADNVIEVDAVAVGGNEWARYEGAVSGALGIGASNGGEIGTQFTLTQAATFDGVRFGFGSVSPSVPPNPPDNWPGQNVVANLRAVDGGTGKPAGVIATTNPIVTTYEGGIYDVTFSTGPLTLQAGTYVVTVAEPVGSTEAMPLLQSLDRFETGTVWVNWPTSPLGDWGNVEEFGAGFRRAPQIGLLSELSIFKDGFDVVSTQVAPTVQVQANKIGNASWPTRAGAHRALSKVRGR